MNKIVAEAIGIFGLVFVGGAAIIADASSSMGILGIALAHGLILMCMVYAFGHISGAHFNPAVTISLFTTKNIELKDAIGYIVGQLAGAALAACALCYMYPEHPANLGTPMLAESTPWMQGIIVEALLAFLLVITIYGTAVDKKAPTGFYGLAIGLVVTANVLAGGTVTGASMNPARSFGPALVSGTWTFHEVFWIGPIIGGLLAGWIYTYVVQEK